MEKATVLGKINDSPGIAWTVVYDSQFSLILFLVLVVIPGQAHACRVGDYLGPIF